MIPCYSFSRIGQTGEGSKALVGDAGIKMKTLFFIYYIQLQHGLQAPVAQWIERQTSNLKVVGSSPTWSSFLFEVSKHTWCSIHFLDSWL